MIRSFEESAGSEQRAQGSASKGHILGALESHAPVLSVDEAMHGSKQALIAIIDGYRNGASLEEVYRLTVAGFLDCFSEKEQQSAKLQKIACKFAAVSIICATRIMQDSEREGENHE